MDIPEAGSESHVPATELPSSNPRGLIPRVIKVGALIAALAALTFAGIPLWSYTHSYESTDDAQIDGHLAPVASRVDGTIAQVFVHETQTVNAGDLLATIDSRDAEVAIENARANLALAQAQVSSARADYDAARGKVAESEATAAKADRDAVRYTSLMDQQVVSRDEYEEQMRLDKVDGATVASDRAAADSSEKVIAAREASVQAAQAALDQALLNLSYTKITAPISGVIGKKTVEVGQRVQSGEQLLAVVNLDDIWVTANFKETQVRRMRPGLRVTIHVDELGRDYSGYVEGMAGASGELYSLIPPENATGNYVKVVQRLPIRLRFTSGQNADYQLRPGLSVEPTVWLR
jgi:membrane fusion protein (multidrug efflux system)